MAWIEHRRSQYRVYERTADGRKAYEPFATREDAELFIAFVAHSGWDASVASVRAPAPPPPPLPSRAHLLASARGTGPEGSRGQLRGAGDLARGRAGRGRAEERRPVTLLRARVRRSVLRRHRRRLFVGASYAAE